MFLEIHYKGSIVTVGSNKTPKMLQELIPKKKTSKNLRMKDIFEEHKKFKFLHPKWTERRYWNYVCWFFNEKYKKNNDEIKDRTTAQIVFWDMLSYYRAWRHVRGYPVNGQRTWSNGVSASKTNNRLRQYRLKQMQTAFGSRKQNNYALLVQAEAVNKLWLRTWPSEWIQGYRHALRSKSRKGTTIPIDLNNLAKAVTTGYYRRGQAEKWNKSKKALKTVTIGLPLYFSRFFFGHRNRRFFKYQLVLAQPDFKKNQTKKKNQIKKKTVPTKNKKKKQ